MTDDLLDPYSQPPDWVPLTDLPCWLQKHFALSEVDDQFIRDIISAIRFRKLIYRVEGFPYMDRLPSGFTASNRGAGPGFRAIVELWEIVEPDWKAGTVGGSTQGGVRRRHTLSVQWSRAVFWAESYVLRLKRQANDAADKRGQRPPKGKQPQSISLDTEAAERPMNSLDVIKGADKDSPAFQNERFGRRGPKPKLETGMKMQMLADFEDRPDALERETGESLKAAYGGSRTTCEKVRKETLSKLRQNSGKTPAKLRSLTNSDSR